LPRPTGEVDRPPATFKSVSASHALIRAVCRPFLFASLFLNGCGFWVRTPLTGPDSPAPSDPPPTSVNVGSISISPQYAALTLKQRLQFSASGAKGGEIEWLVNDTNGNYTAPASIPQSENIVITAALTSSPQQNYATAVAAILLPGQIICPPSTGNPQVALYSIYLPSPGSASVQFGTSTSYDRNTWRLPTPSPNGGQINLYVAGMLANTRYHMRGQIALADGATFNDADQTCTSGAPPTTPKVKISTPGSATPQAGIEMWNPILPQSFTQAVATDLDGNVIWTYTFKGSTSDYLQGIQLLPNGHFLMILSYLSSFTINPRPGLLNEIREVDLAGNTIRSLTMDTLNEALASSNLRDADGNSYHLRSFHHSVLALPNGHWILLAAYDKDYTNLPGHTGTIPVRGDALIDVDHNLNPVWAWNTFDHLDINRQPMNFADWTHSNDILYSSDDHNLLLSIRHQNWIIKIEYLDGAGSGKILWRLGEGGDFKLQGGNDPEDWFYAQHGMSYFTPNTTGVFRIGLMDNGNDRLFSTGPVDCKPSGQTTANCYSTVPILELNETNMTATMVTHYVPPSTYFSYFGGNADLLPNGDVHVDFCAPHSGSVVQELDPTGSQVVWQGEVQGSDQFHATRLPSLYPGVQW